MDVPVISYRILDVYDRLQGILWIRWSELKDPGGSTRCGQTG
jgi:hypothetical protein